MAIGQKQELPKAYEPQQVEDRIYDFWSNKGYFTPQIDPAQEPFVIIMPPPNVTGELHLGHALTATLEDIMIRWHRMRGQPSLWLPGEDHAGIATQVVIERRLAAEGLTRHDVGREEFERRAWEWVRQCRDTIIDQHKKMGASADWTRDTFTLDEGPSRAVAVTFVKLYNKGLIYQGERIINWCPRCQTALSDLEVVHKDLTGNLYYIRYPVVGESGHVIVATTRPETMFGDTAVAVNPKDPRYAHLVGKQVAIPVISRPIPIIGDEAVDPAFGTGSLKITPAHDPVDFEVAQRHNLPMVNILGKDAKLNQEAGPYEGYDRFEAREALLTQLRNEGLLVKIEPHLHAVGHCTRCGTVVEPWVSKQWFVKTQPLAGPAIKAVKDGRIVIMPEQFHRVYLHWMENIRDWCISRQLWWGHRIPVWYCEDCPEPTVAVTRPERCAHCGSSTIYQDPDVLDTWFSSALWPHSTLGWPDDTPDLRYFYPTSVMETGYDILFFWVARMIMMGLENTGDIPFRWVYLHGLVRDEKGEKMSKLRGNVINPLDAIDKYGADALRFSITTGTAPGNDVPLSGGKLESGRNFANKFWNAARFVLRNLADDPGEAPSPDTLPAEDNWILSRLDRLVTETNRLLESFDFGEAESQIYSFIWDEFCDWYIEISKIRLNNPDAVSPLPVLVHVLETSLRLLHPFMPFITEDIWQTLVSYLPDRAWPEALIIAPYPVPTGFRNAAAEDEISRIIEMVRAVRNARAQAKVDPGRRIEAHVKTANAAAIEPHREAIKNLARVDPLIVSAPDGSKAGQDAIVLLVKDVEITLPMLIDVEGEVQRLGKEKESLESRIEGLRARLSDESFVTRAPEAVVDRERTKLRDQESKLELVKERLAQLGR